MSELRRIPGVGPETEKDLIALGYPLEGDKNAPPRKEVSQLLEIVE